MAFQHPLSRGLTLLFALAQLLGAPALSVADALLERASGAQVAHVEDATRDSCNPHHGPDCGVCRALSAVAARPSAGAAPLTALPPVPVGVVALSGASGVPGSEGLPRAPPA